MGNKWKPNNSRILQEHQNDTQEHMHSFISDNKSHHYESRKEK